ncbi:MAG: DegT/DnrJ/EryC1/StrS family aminotransferase [Oscillospiraceae bacterium]|nr:DegT/DnrJ/EryC1/StrS family aminotransferase [Oscillospiraceae bacterium]
MNIPFLPEKADIDAAFVSDISAQIISSGRLSDGEFRKALELDLARETGMSYCLTAASVDSALLNLLISWSFSSHDAVFISALSPPFVVSCVLNAGAVPVYCDIGHNTPFVKAQAIERAVQRCIEKDKFYPRAVILSDMFGIPAPCGDIADICNEYGLLLIHNASLSWAAGGGICNGGTVNEGRSGDAASEGSGNGSAAGGKRGDRISPPLSDAVVMDLSYPSPLSSFGSAAAVLTSNETTYRNLKGLEHYGVVAFVNSSTPSNGNLGLLKYTQNSIPDELTCAVVGHNLLSLGSKIERKAAIAAAYRKALSRSGMRPQLPPPKTPSSYEYFAVKAQSTQRCTEAVCQLRESGVEARTMPEEYLKLLPAFKRLRHTENFLENAVEFYSSSFFLPVYHSLSDAQVEYICDVCGRI